MLSISRTVFPANINRFIPVITLPLFILMMVEDKLLCNVGATRMEEGKFDKLCAEIRKGQ